MKKYSAVVAAFTFLFLPFVSFAHEVYVLSPEEIHTGLTTPAFSYADVIFSDMNQFIFWATIAISVIGLVFLISISRRLEKIFDPFFEKMRTYAPFVSRMTVGISFLAAAYFHALFGPELPLAILFGPYVPWAEFLLVIIGVLIISGRYSRIAALIALGLFSVAVLERGWYMLTYASYLGEIIVLFLIGARHFRAGVPARLRKAFHHERKPLKKLTPLSFLILRVSFGVSLLYASLYAKFIHNNLAFQVASLPLAGHAHSVAYYLGFEPHFLVLGAGIIEIVIALFFIFGIEIRFTALFLECWLMLSLWYFGEAVWPHLILIGIPIAFILYGYDRYSLEGYFFKKSAREPVF